MPRFASLVDGDHFFPWAPQPRLVYCLHERSWSPEDGWQVYVFRIDKLWWRGRALYPIAIARDRRAVGRWSAYANADTLIMQAHRSCEPCPEEWLPQLDECSPVMG